ncbi:fused MFS/spermidine synthase [Kaarinaea lacus]
MAYEVLWVRMLSLQFGVSIFGVVTTVAAFMLGLGGGSLLGINLSRKLTHPLLVFAFIEFAIATISFGIPFLFQWIESWQIDFTKQFPLGLWYFWQFIITGIVLLLPATLMGLGFPLILSLFEKVPSSLGVVYAVNTFGAAIGAIIPLLLLPALGWTSALYIIVGISFCVAVLASIVSRFTQTSSLYIDDGEGQQLLARQIPLLLAYAGIGAVSLMLEISWTRLFGMLFLRTEYVLAIILAVFLIGIATGSFVARYLNRNTWFNILPLLASVFIVTGLWLIPSVTNMVDIKQLTSLNQALLYQGLLITLLTLPVTLIFGAWLPLLNKRLGDSGISGARLYGANSIGAAIGAIVAGLLLTPLIGTYAVIVVSALLILFFNMVWTEKRRLVIAIPLLALAAIPVYEMVPVKRLMPSIYADAKDLYRHEDALNITHVVAKQDGQRLLLADLQRMDASSDPASVYSQRNQARLPLLLHPDPRSALFLGLGTGISMSSSLAYPQLKRTAVEISSGAIEAVKNWFNQVNLNIVDHAIIIRDDARRFIKTDPDKYDVIVGDLFHPDLIGRSALLSKQQFQRVKDRLTDSGIFVQWIALNQFELESLKIILRTFKQVFPDGRLFLDAFRMALVGINGTMSGLPGMHHNLEALSPEGRQLLLAGESEFAWLGRYWGKINVDDSGPIQDEWAPQIEFRLPNARYNGELDLAKLLGYLLKHRPHVSAAAKELDIDSDNYSAFERAYIATELAHRSWLAMLRNNAGEAQRLLRLAYQANPSDHWISYAVADATLENYDMVRPPGITEKSILQSVLKIRPDHAEALKRLWLLEAEGGNIDAAKQYKKQFAELSPLDNALKN